MVVLHMLFGTGMGLLSLFTILFMIAMGIYIFVTLSRKSREPDE